ncbi:MAG: NlpC/P60 family protein [Nitrospirota bacterium]|nr:NlpC/P60 family protein [Nitrospirota bacterium]
MIRSSFTLIRAAVVLSLTALFVIGTAFSAPVVDPALEKDILDLLDRECLSLNKEKLYALLAQDAAVSSSSTDAAVLLKIMEGVIKRTDFDGIAEGKTVEIIGLVYGAHKKGAPLEQLDEIFDVAYVNTVSIDQLYAAAQALKEFGMSEVPQDIYEEFVYHSIENGWDPRVTPVLARGLIYGVDRGLSPDKVALIIMLDVKNGELNSKKPDQLVMDAIKLVREKEPARWRSPDQGERDRAARMDKERLLEKKKEEIDNQLQQKERAFTAATTKLKELREYPEQQTIDQKRIDQDLEALIRKLQDEISQAQNRQRDIVAELETTKKDVEQRQAVKDREKKEKREKELARKQQDIQSRGKQGRLNKTALKTEVDKYLGTPYRFGGDSRNGIDCSAFTRRVYRGQGVELPRTSREQARVGNGVTYSNVRTGDLIFFDTSINGNISHVGVHLGNNVFAHASSSKGVTRSSLKEKYYVKRFVKGGRIFAD